MRYFYSFCSKIHFLITLFTWYNSPDATAWVLNIAVVAWDEVHVNVEDALSRIGAYIDADIVAVGAIFLIQNLLDMFGALPQIGLLGFCQEEIVAFVAFGDDKSVAGINRKTVKEGQA